MGISGHGCRAGGESLRVAVLGVPEDAGEFGAGIRSALDGANVGCSAADCRRPGVAECETGAAPRARNYTWSPGMPSEREKMLAGAL
jgi:hypothetical protein